MGIIPIVKVDQLEFCEVHSDVWLSNPTAIGLTNTQVADFKALTITARSAYDAAQAARDAAKAATTNQNQALSSAVRSASDLIRVIKGFAELSDNPDAIYAIAQIPPPAPPVPATAPGKPDAINVVLEPSGAVTLSWEATNASASSGGFFNISRKLPGQTGFTILGGAPGTTTQSRRMSFTDATVPTSAAGQGAQYIIQGRRGTLTGAASDAVIVQFGIDGLGQVTSASIKMAA